MPSTASRPPTERRSTRARKEADPISVGLLAGDHAPDELSNSKLPAATSGGLQSSSTKGPDAISSRSKKGASKRSPKAEPLQPTPTLVAGETNGLPAVAKRKRVSAGKGATTKRSRPNGRELNPSGGTDEPSAVLATPAEEDSSDDDDAQAVAAFLVRHTNNTSVPSTSKATRIPSVEPEGASSSQVNVQAEETMEAVAVLVPPRIDDQYSSAEDFMRHVRSIAERTGHKAYQQGGQGKLKCRMLCRNWKKAGYSPPGLGCDFHFLARRTETSTKWLVVSAEATHNEACTKHEESLRAKQASKLSGSTVIAKNSKKACKTRQSLRSGRTIALIDWEEAISVRSQGSSSKKCNGIATLEVV